MADTKISALTDGSTADASDRIPLARSPFASGDNRYLTPAYIGTYLAKNTLAAGTITTDQPHAITQTWNAGGVTFTAFKVNATSTASAAGSRLMDLQVAGTTKVFIRKDGVLGLTSNQTNITGIGANGASLEFFTESPTGTILFGNDATIRLGSTKIFGWTSGTHTASLDTILVRDASDTLAQRNSTTAQTFRIYNTYTDASNFERGFAQWSGNVFQIGSANAGTGTARSLEFVSAGGAFTLTSGTITTSKPMLLTQTWNAGAVTFTGLNVNVTNTASAAASLLQDWQIGGVSQAKVKYDGSISINSTVTVNPSFSMTGSDARTFTLNAASSGASLTGFLNTNYDNSGGGAHFSAYSGNGATSYFQLFGDAADILALRRTTNAQTFRIYNTYTDGSNYERGFLRWSSNVLQIGAEKAGTGTARAVTIFSGTATLRLESGTGVGADVLVSTGDAGTVNDNCTVSFRANSALAGYVGRISSLFGLFNSGGTKMVTFDDSTGVANVAANTATPAGGSTSARLIFGTTSGFGIYYGSGAPSVSAAQGSIYLRSDGSSTSTRLYVNTTGSTTWTNVTTAA